MGAKDLVGGTVDDADLVPPELPEPALSEILAPTNDFVAMGEALREQRAD